jgi:hypothetical protein
MAWVRLVFWGIVARPSYWLYLAKLPSGYGYVSAKHMRALIDLSRG